MTITQYDPDNWLTSLFGSLTDYINAQVDDSEVVDDVSSGLEIYEIVFSYPIASELPGNTEFVKTKIHFEIDDAENSRLGFGESFVNATYVEAVDDTPGYVTNEQASVHVVNFDVGIWASDVSGGVTSRLRAYQLLEKSFNGEIARQKCLAATGGIEIRSFNGGRFVTETINDIRVFRIVGAELIVRVYSRDIAMDAVIVDGEPIQTPDLEITDESATLVQLVDE